MEDEHVEEVEESTVEEVVEQVEETTTETDVVEETEAEVDQPEEKPEDEFKGISAKAQERINRRIAKVTRERGDAQRALAELQHQVAQQPVAQPVNTDRPTEEQFDFDQDKYQEALTDWKVDQKFADIQKKNAASQQQAQQNKVVQEFESKKQATAIEGVTKYDDYEDVVINNGDVNLTFVMADIITDSEIGHDIAYYLCSNPQESDRISRLTPLKQAAAVTRLEAQLTGTPKKKISTAGKPVKSVGGKGSTTTKIDPAKDTAKWIAERNKQMKGR